MINEVELKQFITNAFDEDIKGGDHTSLSCIPAKAEGKARLLVKADGILAGVELAKKIFAHFDSDLKVETFIEDGSSIKYGDIAFIVSGKKRSILTTERLVLNCMQRMSGIATLTNKFVEAIKPHKAQILDTRKTTPLIRFLEKWAVRIGGGTNHRFGLYDMIMLKDNHVDYCGGIEQAIKTANEYISKNNLDIKIEIEVRDLDEMNQVLAYGNVDRIMLDNFEVPLLKEAVKIIDGRFETEASGGITLETVHEMASTGVDFISSGALTHSYKSLDLSLKAID